MNLSFEQRAELLGHSPELLREGASITTAITVNDVDHLKELITKFGGTDPHGTMAEHLFGDIPPTSEDADRSAAGTLRRTNEFIYGDAELSSGDRERIAGAFPMTFNATSAPNYTPTAPVKINSPVSPQIFNYGTVTLNKGIYINIYNTVITAFTMDELVRNDTNENSNIGDINIFGATGQDGASPSKGATGKDGAAGSGGTCTVSGSEPGSNGGPGHKGATGAPGKPGGQGSVGKPSMQATFTINKSVTGAQPVLFFTRSGTGGSGGVGSTGGKGGNGGKGGDGKSCECTGTSGGVGGQGGSGGTGGKGGDAGDAVNKAGNIVIYVPTAYASKITHNSATAQPGAFGAGGPGGAGGAGGGSSSGGKGKSGGAAGTAGATGGHGGNGSQSQVTGTPATFQINQF